MTSTDPTCLLCNEPAFLDLHDHENVLDYECEDCGKYFMEQAARRKLQDAPADELTEYSNFVQQRPPGKVVLFRLVRPIRVGQASRIDPRYCTIEEALRLDA